MSTQPNPTQLSTYRVLVTDQLAPALTAAEDRHYESPPQSEQQARALLAILLGASRSRDHCGPWRQAIAGGQRIVELRASS
jgi:hypothetical protein